MKSLSKNNGIAMARRLRQRLLEERIPVHAVYLFGSVAGDKAHEWSDVDIAILCTPFRSTRHDESMEVRRLRRDVDMRISPVCLHPDDFDNRLFGLEQEIKKHGIEV